VSKGAHYVCATKVHVLQNCKYPPKTMTEAMRDPTSSHGFMSHKGAGALFRSFEAVFGPLIYPATPTESAKFVFTGLTLARNVYRHAFSRYSLRALKSSDYFWLGGSPKMTDFAHRPI
jgi:hypothetical protein